MCEQTDDGRLVYETPGVESFSEEEFLADAVLAFCSGDCC